MRPQLVDGLIIGAGPAGLSAALGFARLKATALVFDSQDYRNEGIQYMHTVPSRDHFDPHEFRRISRDQMTSRYETVWFENVAITHATKKLVGGGKYDGFELKDANRQRYEGRKLIIATGSKDILPDIEGYKDNWPSHIYQCLACDGYEQRDTPIGMLELNPLTAHFVYLARKFDPRVTIFTNGPVSTTPQMQHALKVSKAFGAKLDERKIKRFINNGPSHAEGITIEFEEGHPVTLGFVVHRPLTANRAQDLIDQLGLETVAPEMGGHIVVKDMFNATSVKGVFAGGDTMVIMKQAAIAMAEGLKAAAGAQKEIGEEGVEEALKAL